MVPPSSKEGSPTHRGATDPVLVHPEQLFRAIFEQAAVGVALIETATGRFVRVNQRYCDIVGLLRDDMTATTFMAITHPDDLQADLNNMEELKAGRIREFCMEKRYFRSDGSIVWVDLTVSPLWKSGEQPSFHIAVVQDITGRKVAEQDLAALNATLEAQVAKRTSEVEKSRRQLQAILDGTSDAVFIKDVEGRYLLFNNAAERFVGKRQNEVIGRDDRFIFPATEAQAVMEADRKVMTDCVTMTYEDVVTTADGVQRTFLSTKGPLRDGHGQVTGLFGISRDITELRRAQETLEQRVAERTAEVREREAQLAQLIAHFPGTVARLDRDLRYRYASPRYEQWFGKPSHVMIGSTMRDVIGHGAFERAKQAIERVLAGEEVTFENHVVLASGQEKHILVTFEPELDAEGGCSGFAVFVVDITERKRAYSLLQATMHSVEDGLLVIDRQGKVTSTNQRFFQLWKLPRELMDSQDDDVLLGAVLEQLAQPDAFLRKVQDLYAHPEQESFDILEFKDGRVFERYSCPQILEGEVVGRVWSFRDVTERKRAEAELIAARAQLEQRVVERTTALREVNAALLGEITERQQVENRLRLTQFTVDRAADGIFWVSPSAEILYVNENACKVLGYTREELIGKTVHDIDPNFPAEAWPAHWEDVRTRGSFTFPSRQHTKEGTIRHTEVTVNYLEYDGKEYNCAVVRDVTQRMQTELAMRELTLAQSFAMPGIAKLDRHGCYCFVNEHYAAVLACSADDLLGQSWEPTVVPEDLPLAYQAYADMTATGKGECEVRGLRRDGSLFYKQVVLVRIEDSADGLGGGNYCFIREITERKQLEEDLKRSHAELEQRVEQRTAELSTTNAALQVEIAERMRTEAALRLSEQFRTVVLDSLSASVAVVDQSGMIVAVNQVWERAAAGHDPLGTAKLGVGVNYLHVCRRAADSSPEGRQTLDGLSEVLSGREKSFETEYVCATPQGLRWFAMRVTPLGDRHDGAVVTHEDITERKRAEDALRYSYDRLRVLSREVQIAEERERSRLSRELHDEFGQLLSALKFDLGRITNEVTKGPPLSRLTLGRKLAGTSKVVDRLFSSLRELIRGLRPALLEELGLVPALEALAADVEERSGLCYHLTVDDEENKLPVGPEVEGALYRIVQELLTNVMRHAEAKNVSISLHIQERAVCLTVKDDGRGMSKTQGIGKNRFGLRGIRERVELIGGHVKIRSGESRGTTITVHIPIELPLSSALHMDPDRPRKSGSTRKSSHHGR